MRFFAIARMTWLALILGLASPLEAKPPKRKTCRKVPQRKATVYRYKKGSLVQRTHSWVIKTGRVKGLSRDPRLTVYRVPQVQHLKPLYDVQDVSWDLYLVRAGCARRIGQIYGPGEPFPLRTSRFGLMDFEQFSANKYHFPPPPAGAYGGHSILIRYRYDGKRYVGGRPRRR